MNKRANIGLISSVAFHGLLILALAFSGIFSSLHKQSKMLEITFVDVSGGGGGGGAVNVSQGMAQRNAREMPSEAIQRTQKTEPTIVPVLVTNNLTEKIDTKVQVTNNASM